MMMMMTMIVGLAAVDDVEDRDAGPVAACIDAAPLDAVVDVVVVVAVENGAEGAGDAVEVTDDASKGVGTGCDCPNAG